jgi:pectate lyase
VRFGETVHVFNNYYSNILNDADSYAIASTMNAGTAGRSQRLRAAATAT